MTPPPDAAAPPRPGRLLRGALFVSLTVNLLVAGLVIGALWTRGDGVALRPVQVDVGLGLYTRALAEPDRAALREAWRGRGPDLRALRAARQADLTALVAALRAQPFEPAAVEAVLERQRQRHASQQDLARTLLAERLAILSPAERAAYADRLEALARRGDRRPDRSPRTASAP